MPTYKSLWSLFKEPKTFSHQQLGKLITSVKKIYMEQNFPPIKSTEHGTKHIWTSAKEYKPQEMDQASKLTHKQLIYSLQLITGP